MECTGPSACQNGGECRAASTASHSNESSAVSCDCPLGFGGDYCQEGEEEEEGAQRVRVGEVLLIEMYPRQDTRQVP